MSSHPPNTKHRLNIMKPSLNNINKNTPFSHSNLPWTVGSPDAEQRALRTNEAAPPASHGGRGTWLHRFFLDVINSCTCACVPFQLHITCKYIYLHTRTHTHIYIYILETVIMWPYMKYKNLPSVPRGSDERRTEARAARDFWDGSERCWNRW
jgi:hypothetical protein